MYIFISGTFAKKGFSALFIVMVLGTVGLFTVFVLLQSGLDSALHVNESEQSFVVREKLLSCFDELMARLSQNPQFSEPEIIIGDSICTSDITFLNNNQRSIELSLQEDNFLRRMTIILTVDPVIITNIVER